MARTRQHATPTHHTDTTDAQHDEAQPRGTLLILLLYLVLIIVLWGSMFLVMLERS